MRFKKSIFYIILSLFFAGTFVGCSPKKNVNINNEQEQSVERELDKNLSVGFVTTEKDINDGIYDQKVHTGIKKAVDEFDIKYNIMESKNEDNYEKNLQGLIGKEVNFIFTSGISMVEAVEKVAKENKDIRFAIIDNVVNLDNVESVVFREYEGSFLMGVIAGKTTKTNKIGFLGGSDITLINRFEAGFVAGVMSVNPEAGKLLMDRSTVKYMESFTDINKSYEAAETLYNDGCDVIYHSAGAAGFGMFSAAKEQKKAGKEVWCIGVGVDQAKTMSQFEDVILSSMVKNIEIAVYDTVKKVAYGNFQGGKIVELGLRDKAMDIAESTSNNTSKEVIELAEKYKEAIIKGQIKVPSSIQELKEFEVVKLGE